MTPRWRLNKAWIRGAAHQVCRNQSAHPSATGLNPEFRWNTQMHTPGVEDTCSCGLTPFVAPAVSSVCLFLNLVFLSVWLEAGAAPVSSPGVTRDLWSLSEPRRPWTAGPGSGLAPDSSRGLGKQVPVIVLPSWHVEHDNKIIYFFSPGSSHIWCLPYTGAS